MPLGADESDRPMNRPATDLQLACNWPARGVMKVGQRNHAALDNGNRDRSHSARAPCGL